MNPELPRIKFTSFLSESSFLRPFKIHESSAWVQHVPFAFWLAEQLRPHIFVELGVHTGISYFAFCQSVQVNNLSTKCFGIDTWKGDEHSGLYTDQVWQEVSGYNHGNYASFSYLLRSTFQEALPYFEDHSIDLLHIDGFHTYEAVKTDFENWLPKISGRGIVLFHDIMVREREFGVFRFWNELKSRYPSFEFFHGHGLGVLAVGEVSSPLLQSLFELEDEEEQNKLRSAYASLGGYLSERLGAMSLHHLLAGANNRLGQLEAENRQLQSELDQLNSKYNEETVKRQELERASGALQTESEQLRLQGGEGNEQIKSLTEELQVVRSGWEDSRSRGEELRQQLEQRTQELVRVNHDLDQQRQELAGSVRDLEQSRHELAQRDEELRQVNQELEQVRDQFRHSVQEAEETIASLTASLETLENTRLENSRLQAELAGANLQLRELQDLKQEAEMLDKALKASGHELSGMKNELEKLTLKQEQSVKEIQRKEQELQHISLLYRQVQEKAEQLQQQKAAAELSHGQAVREFENEKEEIRKDLREQLSQLSALNKALAAEKLVTEEMSGRIQRQEETIAWYRRTYEERGLLGIIKDRLSK
jgi:chromosome segregation ATPase